MNTTDSVVTALENAPGLIVPMVKEVPEAILKRRPAPGKWSAHEHACHLAAVHQLFFTRLDLMLTEQHPLIKPYLPDKDDEDDALLKVDLAEALNRFEQDRKTLVERLRKLSPDDWQRTAEHPEYNRYSIFILFRHAAMHDMLHSYRIEELLLKPDW